ncbi:hypothetical protein O7627_36450 [Solwaraspora sp. WMMD1047]|uniref:hypothetical protein n=1 Tax=Solwaraspora sp. WMMD1047 TaxID=3016102 RepID=UPI002416E4EE|nr:hypothetical protein [Solwaraspora sp. WMMD1047]MDG4834760.1 hypothetical protein [Solwaraspora sp. WMMD1047]
MTTLPQLLRHRRATVAVAALFVSAPPLVSGVALIGPGVAVAEPATSPASASAGKIDLVFRGDALLGVRCRASAEQATYPVAVGTSLRVVNRTGRRSVLLLDGVARGELAAGSGAQLVVHQGPVVVTLRPICAFATEATARVEVAAPEVPVGDADALAPSAVRPGAAEGYLPGPGWRERPAVELSGVEPLRDRGPTGLLALVAAVCVVGVSAGAIRAIIAQRSTRTVVA